MRIIIYCGMVTIWLVMGAGLAVSGFNLIPEQHRVGEVVAVIGMCSGVLGLGAAELLLYSIGSRRPRRRRKRKRNPKLPNVPTPRSFQSRLAKFAGTDEQHVMDETEEHASNMPFWTLANDHSRTEPKPASFFRHILYRIRAILRTS